MRSNTSLYLLALLVGGVIGTGPTGGAGSGSEPASEGSSGTSTTTTTTKTKNVAIPKAGKACTSKITFPIKKLKGVKGYPWIIEVFGIPMVASDKFYKSGKLNHVASILAELLDNDSDGCADDPNVLRNILTKYVPPNSTSKKGLRKAVVLPDNPDSVTEAAYTAAEKKGFLLGQIEGETETIPKCSGLKFTKTCSDASIEEINHFINSFGHTAAYPKLFGVGWNDNSTLTRGMDKARGKRIQKTPSKLSGYSKKAWYRYIDTSCDYGCQSMEYLWWGYCSYTGVCAGRSGSSQYETEFKLLKKADLVKTDKVLTKLFKDSEKKTASYRLPTKPVDGIYTGCKKCSQTGGKSHGGS